MIETAKILTILAVPLAMASLHPRLRLALKMSYGCVGLVALCLLGDAIT